MGFSFMPVVVKNNDGEKVVEQTVKHFRIESGVNRDFPAPVWESIKDYAVVKRLIGLGALEITEDAVDVPVDACGLKPPAQDTLDGIKLDAALSLVEGSFDVDQLKRWNAKDQRIRVRNAISSRITAITEGKG